MGGAAQYGIFRLFDQRIANDTSYLRRYRAEYTISWAQHISYRLFFPYLLSASVVGLIIRWMLGEQFGIANYLLESIGLGPVPFISEYGYGHTVLECDDLVVGFGFPMLIYLAGLSNIPQDIYEAARIDGARGWQMTRYITIPLLRPTILFVAVTQLISHFQVFAQPYVITNGGPGQASFTVIIYMFRAA